MIGPSTQTMSISKRKNELAWLQVEIVEQFNNGDPRVHCFHCDHEFRGGASRIVEHLIGPSGAGKANVRRCSKCPEYVAVELRGQSDNVQQAKAKKQRVALLETVLNSQNPIN